ncbi:hypothetical protein [Nonomuraea sp. NPDC050310]|uniref:hypothetical protein n=1 Tax=Nonomuraea sp. NPDC050310 TaxID=3154935 RepID=UPI0033E12311
MAEGMFRAAALRRVLERRDERERLWLPAGREFAAFWVAAVVLLLVLGGLALVRVPAHVQVPAVVKAGQIQVSGQRAGATAVVRLPGLEAACTVAAGRALECPVPLPEGARGVVTVERGHQSVLSRLLSPK